MHENRFRSARVLVVDDEPANVHLLERILERAGYTDVRATTDPREVVALASEYRPDIVLLDLNMPHVDGFTLLRDLAAQAPAGSAVPVLVLTADITPRARDRALSSGARDFVTKPFDGTEVLLRIRNLLESRFMHADLQQQLRHAQKLEVLGRLTGGIAHDFNNLLTAIKGNAQMLLMDVPEGHPMREDLMEIDGAAERAAALTRQLLGFSRGGPATPREVELNAVVRGLQRTLLHLVGGRVKLAVAICPHECRIFTDQGQLEQVLMNLVVNARDAMPTGGTITIATARSAGEAVLSVADTGEGIDAEVLDRIFEPFFTTKGPGQGTGLGLSIVRGIVEQGGGRIEVQSQPAVGSTFAVRFPLANPALRPGVDSRNAA